MKKANELSQDFQTHIELIKKDKEIEALRKSIETLLKEIETLRKSSGVSKAIKINVTPEEQIIDEQIALLQRASMVRALEINEVKMLDMYIKNKRLLSEKSTMNADFTSLPDTNLSDEALLALVEGSNNAETEENSPADTSGEDTLD